MTLTMAETEATERKRKVEKYFHPTPKQSLDQIATALLAVGGIAVLVGLIALNSNAFIGIVMMAGGIYSAIKGGAKKKEYRDAYEKAEPKPSDREMDRLLAQDLKVIEERAMQRLGITPDHLEIGAQSWDPVAALLGTSPSERPEKRPLVLYGPNLSGFGIGDDGVWRFQEYEVLVVCPTLHHLALFHCSLDFLSGGLSKEDTEEYQYNHVVAVSTKTTPAPSNISLEQLNTRTPDDDSVHFSKVQRRRLEVSVSNGQSMGVTVGISDEDDSTKRARLQSSGIDEVIGSIRRVLRDRSR
ncbi:hypothetical protein [Streptomyces geranii]|uniref:hypothetical protein n=1 Tax=Streptomyces geranii TaxID=2058923 RepID=UPI000D022524|nr:hypothetical protein [Streptomyces geranii]